MIRLFKTSLLLLIGAVIGLHAIGQEILAPIYHPAAQPSYKMGGKGQFIYEIDTLSLPFVDDFSVDLVKRYNAQPTDAGLDDTLRYDFKVDGDLVDSLWYSDQPTYWLVLSLSGDSLVVDSTTLTSYSLEQFQGSDYSSLSGIFEPTSSTTVYDPYPIVEVGGDTVTLTSDSVFYLGTDSITVTVEVNKMYLDSTTFFIVPDDNTLWMPSGARVNRSYGIDPPTIGVATFDGVDANGHPYDFPGANLQGHADTLQSKPIDLSLEVGDSTFLSFFYQPEGYGEQPDGVDSLYLEFWLPDPGIWKWAWSSPGKDSAAFEYVEVFVPDTFKTTAFEFRFRNYATLSGSFDHWHIDYVLLDAGRTTNDTIRDDLAIVSCATTLLKEYQSMPWGHFMEDPDGWMADTLPFTIVNFTANDVNAPNIWSVYDTAGTEIFSSNPSENNITQFPAGTTASLSHSVVGPPSNFTYPSSAGQQEDFTVTLQMGHSVKDDIASNHQVSFNQHFSTYYAYDDGVAESTYGLDGEDAMLAIQFTTPTPDTLENILIYFPILIDTIVDYTFKLTVWQDDLLGEPLYQRTIAHAPFYGTLDQFIGYPLDTALVVSGTFYVGYQQLEEDILYVGFDMNNNYKSKTAYSLDNGDSWYNSSFKGVPMIRPNFGGWEKVLDIPQSAAETPKQLLVYPVPANESIQIANWQPGMTAQVLDVQGRVLRAYIDQSTVQVADLSPGMYVIKASQNGRFAGSATFVVNR